MTFSDNYWWYLPQPYYPAPYNVGWSCPRCGRIWAPAVATCPCPTMWTTHTNDTTAAQTNVTVTLSGSSSTWNLYTQSQGKMRKDKPEDDDGSDPVGAPV